MSDDDARDLRLVAAVRAGEPDAWRELLTRYQDRLFGVCLRMVGSPASPRSRDLAADLCQDAMVKILQGLNTYDGSAKLSTWMIRVTMNVCLSYLRGQKLRRHASLDAGQPNSPGNQGGSGDGREGPSWASLLESRELSSESGVSHREAKAHLAAALARLDPEQRAILILRDVRSLDYAHIAGVLGIPEGTVKSRLFRARAALRQEIERLGTHEP